MSFSNGFPHDVSGRSISPYLKKKVLLVGLSNSTINSNGIQIELDNWSVFENSSRKITSISVYNNGWQNGKVPFFSHSVQYDNHQAGPFSSGAVGFGLSFRTPGIKIFKVVVHFSNNTNDSAFYKANMVFTPTSTSQGNLAPTNSTSEATLIPILDLKRLTNGGKNLSGPTPSKPGIISFSNKNMQSSAIPLTTSIGSNALTQPPRPDSTWNITSTIRFKGYDNGIYVAPPSSGIGLASIYLATNTSTKSLKKPIILLNGFDPQGQRTNDTIYSRLFPYYDLTGALRNLGDDLRKQGYDVIILTFPGFTSEFKVVGGGRRIFTHGADYIERNAFVLYDVIQRCNLTLTKNGSKEKLVIVGPSMGGLISKYCLSFMEKHNINHNTRLWVSFDSPHQGANLPIGDQFFVDYSAHNLNSVSAKKSRDSQIGSPAAQEMLVDYYANAPSYSPYRAAFLQNLADVGNFPKKVRNVAISNGSINGTKQPGLKACDLLVDFSESYFLRELCFFSHCLINIKTDLYHAIVRTEGVSGDNCKVFHANQLFGLVQSNKNVSNSGPTGYDNCPGGSTDINKIIVTGATGRSEASGIVKPLFAPDIIWNANFSDHTFMPTVSALDVSGSNDLGEDLSAKNLVCLHRTPFRAYYAPLINESHVLVTANNVAFLMQELRQDTLGTTGIGVYGTTPAMGDGGYKITGPTSICQGFKGSYKVTSPNNMIVNWTTSGDLKIISGNGTRLVTISSTGSLVNASFIQASIIGTCGSYIVKNLLIQPGFTGINVQMTACNGTVQSWILDAIPNIKNATNWHWTVDNPASLNCYFSSPNQSNTYADVSGGGGVTVTFTDSCGGVHKDGVTIYSNCGHLSSAVIFPNPSKTIVNVDFNITGAQPTVLSSKIGSLTAIMIPESVQLFSSYSTNPIITVTNFNILAHNNVAIFNVKGFLPGFYYLHILFKDHKEFQTVQIN